MKFLIALTTLNLSVSIGTLVVVLVGGKKMQDETAAAKAMVDEKVSKIKAALSYI